MSPLDLSLTTVFLDFDGTITQHDSCVHLLNRTAGDSLRSIEDRWVSGAIGSRECLQRQWELIPVRDEEEVRRIAREVPLGAGNVPAVRSIDRLPEGTDLLVVNDVAVAG